MEHLKTYRYTIAKYEAVYFEGGEKCYGEDFRNVFFTDVLSDAEHELSSLVYHHDKYDPHFVSYSIYDNEAEKIVTVKIADSGHFRCGILDVSLVMCTYRLSDTEMREEIEVIWKADKRRYYQTDWEGSNKLLIDTPEQLKKILDEFVKSFPPKELKESFLYTELSRIYEYTQRPKINYLEMAKGILRKIEKSYDEAQLQKLKESGDVVEFMKKKRELTQKYKKI